MKKIVILVFVTVIIVISIVAGNYIEYQKQQAQINSINKEYLVYENKTVQINTIVTLMNKAIQQNNDNNIEQDENEYYKENDTNSIKIFLEMKSRDAVIPMEDLILNEVAGNEKVEYAFSDMIFKITEIEYHENTGQVKKIIFTAIEE